MKKKDKVFDQADVKIHDFVFNKKVATVFDDMVTRSVPYYLEMQRMTAELARDFVTEASHVYDIGCSTGTTLLHMDSYIAPKDVTFIGIDNSYEMLQKAKKKLGKKLKHPFRLDYCDLHQGLTIENASLVTLILTLQFVRPLQRENIIRQIYEGLNANGALIMVEKVTSEDTIFNRLFIEHYYDFKRRNGYSEIEIAKKREALENVLIPYRMDENFDLLKRAGFKHVEVFFRWYNFCGIIAVK
ncbi:MAG: carboxy-S-adenosyl-L-methionine synthase CmoA [Rickettsiales bacterium]